MGTLTPTIPTSTSDWNLYMHIQIMKCAFLLTNEVSDCKA